MLEIKKNLTKYRKELFKETDEELIKLNRLNEELNIVSEHSGDKITFTKSKLQDYLDLGFKYKLIEGYNLCLDKFKELIEDSEEDTDDEDLEEGDDT